MLAAASNRSAEFLYSDHPGQQGNGMEGAMRSGSEEGGTERLRGKDMTDVLGTGTRAWRAEKPSGSDRAGTVDYQALGAEILHSARTLGLGIGRKYEHGNDSSNSRWSAQSLMTWGCRTAWVLVFIALVRIGWKAVMMG